jgi:hypothetical protein
VSRARLAVTLGALALLAACSALKLTYNRLDWIAAWQISRFVDLGPGQKAQLEESFRDFWQWHRGTQLGLYVKDLQALAAAVEKPLTAPQVEQYLDLSQKHLAHALQEAVPDTAKLLQTFDDAQVAEMLENMAERRKDRAEDAEDMTAEDLREEAEENMIRNLKRWTGTLNREQKARIRDWSRERQYAGTVWLQYQDAWANAFTQVLAHRREPDFAKRLSLLFDGGKVPYGEEMAKVQKHNRQAWIGLMADLSASLTPEQRVHLQARVRELAADLEELAGQAPRASDTSGAPAEIIG